MKKTLTLVLGMMLFLSMIGFISAQVDNLGRYDRDQQVRIAQVCSDATYVTISSISSPNSTILIDNVNMTSSGSGEYYYLFLNTSQIGRYDVRGISDGCEKTFSFYFNIGGFTAIEIAIYIFFLLLCLSLTFLSAKLLKKNTMVKDINEDYNLYEMKKRNEGAFLINVLKKKTWIVGVFGIYLSILIFTVLFNQLIYNLVLTDLNQILKYVVLLMSWGLIPFVIFWFVYVIIFLYKTTANIMRYQFGKGVRK